MQISDRQSPRRHSSLGYIRKYAPSAQSLRPLFAVVCLFVVGTPKANASVEGSPEVISTAVFVVAGQRVTLAHIEGVDGVQARGVAAFIASRGGTITCVPAPSSAGMRCRTQDGVDLAEAALFNGGARAAVDAPPNYRAAEQTARDARRGIWAQGDGAPRQASAPPSRPNTLELLRQNQPAAVPEPRDAIEQTQIVANFARRYPSTYQAIQADTRASDAVKTVAVLAIERALRIGNDRAFSETVIRRLGIGGETMLRELANDPTAALSRAQEASGTEIAISAAVAVSAAFVADTLVRMAPLRDLPPHVRTLVRAFLEAAIVEAYGTWEAVQTGPTGLVGRFVDRAIDLVEVVTATAGAAQAQDAGLAALAMNIATAVTLVEAVRTERAQRIAATSLRDARATIADIVGHDDAAAVATIVDLGERALRAKARGDTAAARTIAREMLTTGRAEGNITPFAAIRRPADWLIAVARGGRDAPQRAAEIFLAFTPLAELSVTQAQSDPFGDVQALLRDLARRFEGPVEIHETQRFGRVALLRVSIRDRNSGSQQYVAVDAARSIRLVTSEAGRFQQTATERLSRRHADPSMWPETQAFLGTLAGPNGGVELRFAMPVTASCRACEVIGVVRVTLQFDAAGRHLGTRLVDAQPLQRGARWDSEPRPVQSSPERTGPQIPARPGIVTLPAASRRYDEVISATREVSDGNTGCKISTEWTNVTSVSWSGACVEGRGDGDGTALWFNGDELVWMTRFGPAYGVVLRRGQQHFNIDMSEFQIRVEWCRNPGAGIFINPTRRDLDNWFLGDARVTTRIIRIALAIAVELRCNALEDWRNVRIHINDKINSPGAVSPVYLDNLDRQQLAWNSVTNSPANSIANSVGEENHRLQQARLAAEIRRHVDALGAQRREIEGEWAARWDAALRSSQNLVNLADIIGYNRPVAIQQLISGRTVEVLFANPEVRDGVIFVSNRHDPSNIYAAMQTDPHFSHYRAELRQPLWAFGTVIVTCQIDPTALPTLREGQRYAFTARLVTLDGSRAHLRCSAPRPAG